MDSEQLTNAVRDQAGQATGHIWRGGHGTRYRTSDLIFLFPIPNMAGGYRPLPGQANKAEFRTIDARGTRHGTRRHAA